MSDFAPAPIRREHAFSGRATKLFDGHLKRLRWSASFFAEKVGRSQQAIHSYLSGRARFPLGQVPIWAAMLGLTGDDRTDWIVACQEAHVPPAIWQRMRKLEQLAEKAKPAPTDAALEKERAETAATVARLVALLAEAEAIFFARSLSAEEIHTRRPRLGASIRQAIEKHSRPGTTPAQGMTAEGQAPG